MKLQGKDNIKKSIKKIFLKEFLSENSGWDTNNDISLFHGFGGQKFPYGNSDTPEDIGRKTIEQLKYQDNSPYKAFSSNKDIYKFPFEEFKLGLDTEIKENKKQKNVESIFDTASRVLEKISDDIQFYSKATSYETNFKDNK